MAVVVVRGARSDAGAAARIHRQSARIGFAHIFPATAQIASPDQFLAEWEERLNRPDVHLYLAENDGHRVGTVVTSPDGELARLYVLPQHWAMGVGRALHDVAISDIRQRRLPQAHLWVLEGNTRARSWYERLGWQVTDQRKPTDEPAGIYDAQYILKL